MHEYHYINIFCTKIRLHVYQFLCPSTRGLGRQSFPPNTPAIPIICGGLSITDHFPATHSPISHYLPSNLPPKRSLANTLSIYKRPHYPSPRLPLWNDYIQSGASTSLKRKILDQMFGTIQYIHLLNTVQN